MGITKTNGHFCSEVPLSNVLASWNILVTLYLDAKDKVNYLQINKEFYCYYSKCREPTMCESVLLLKIPLLRWCSGVAVWEFCLESEGLVQPATDWKMWSLHPVIGLLAWDYSDDPWLSISTASFQKTQIGLVFYTPIQWFCFEITA